jgi:hypothetical protein
MMQMYAKLMLAVVLISANALIVYVPSANAAGNISIVSYSHYYDSLNDLWVVGELTNRGNVPTRFSKVNAIFYNASREVVSVQFGYSDLDVLLPNRKSPFSILLLESEGSLKVYNYTLTVSWDDYPSGMPIGLEILSNYTSIDTYGWMHVTGEIKNTGTTMSNYTQVFATFYDANGTVVATEFTYVDPDPLMPSQTTAFELILTDTDQVQKVANYRLTAESWQYEVKYEFPRTDSEPPVTSNNYDGLWHTTDFGITLTATDDFSGVNDTFYKINNGQTQNVSIGGQPIITSESANNILEYWSVDNVGHEESHHFLTGIKLDKIIPLGSIAINNGAIYTNSTSVTLSLNATDTVSGIYRARFSNDGAWDTEQWESFSPTKSWTLTSGDGTKIVYFQVKDNAGLISSTYSSSTLLDTNIPSIGTPLRYPSGDVQPNQPVEISANVTDSGSGLDSVRLTYFTNESAIGLEVSMALNQTNGLYESMILGQEANTILKYQITAHDNAGNIAVNDNAGQYYVYTVIPEFSLLLILPLFIMATLLAAIVHTKRVKA